MKPTKPKDQRGVSLFGAEFDRELAERAECDDKNRQALVALLAEFEIRLAKSLALWRPTVRENGTLVGLEHLGTLEILATDGIGAFFLRPNGETLFGHVHSFTGEIKPLFSTPKAKETFTEWELARKKAKRRGAATKKPESLSKKETRAAFLAQFE